MRKYPSLSHSAPRGPLGYAVLYEPAGPPSRVVPIDSRARGLSRPATLTRARARAAVRRRRVLAVLLLAVTVPALVALATGSTAAWWVVVALLPVACAYVAVLFHTRRLMAEREINHAFFGSRERAEATLAEVFPGNFVPAHDELGAVSAGRY